MVEVNITTTTGAESALDENVVEEFSKGLRGKLVRPGDDTYDAARKVWNGAIDKRPALIACCAGVADVVGCVNFARDHDLLVSVRGGGHNIAGNAVCDGGLTIDLSKMKGIRVDPARRTARAEPGLKLGEFDRETQAFGLATTMGVNTDTGIAGLTLGGGYGWLAGKYGLTCDNLLAVDIVTADGQLVKASASENEDLFWGVRGGGGNFGVVTSFEYRLHPVGPVLGGMSIYPMAKAREVLRFFHEFSSTVPDELSTFAALLTTPDGDLAVAIAVCYCGSLEEGDKVLSPLRKFGSPVADMIGPMPYVELQSVFDGGFVAQECYYWKTSLIRELRDGSIEAIESYAARKPTPMSAIGIQQLHGAAIRVGATETAFAHRYSHYNLLPVSIWRSPADSEKSIRWVRELWEAMQPFLERDAYGNDMGEEGEERVRSAYGINYERLVALKNRYDPTNFFRLNQNIRPAV
jgi:FAD/FMN-containing dehydrogenase